MCVSQSALRIFNCPPPGTQRGATKIMRAVFVTSPCLHRAGFRKLEPILLCALHVVVAQANQMAMH